MKVPLSQVLGVVTEENTKIGKGAGTAEQTRRPSGSVTVRVIQRDEPETRDINVIGCTVEEATRRVDKFLDQAALEGKPEVRIIHGHGTGALRRGLGEFLTAHPLVQRIRPEAEERGGNAVTVVELKD
jgi:DNA mismatch repair protein MutS2